MDPDAALTEMRGFVDKLRRHLEDQEESPDLADYDRFVDLFNGLDDWIADGGFLPEAWRTDDRR